MTPVRYSPEIHGDFFHALAQLANYANGVSFMVQRKISSMRALDKIVVMSLPNMLNSMELKVDIPIKKIVDGEMGTEPIMIISLSLKDIADSPDNAHVTVHTHDDTDRYSIQEFSSNLFKILSPIVAEVSTPKKG